MEKYRPMDSANHRMADWIDRHSTRSAVAETAGCSLSHLANILARRKQASLPLARKLSAISGGAVPIEAFDLEAAQ